MMQDATQDPTWNRKLTWPNAISVARLLIGMPALFYVLVFLHDGVAAVVVFGGFALSDNIDGYIARHYRMRSKFGQKLDPTIDRIYITFACVMVIFTVSWWLLVILGPFIVREITLGFFFIKLNRSGRETGSPSEWGKRSAFLTCIVVVISVLAFVADGNLQQLAVCLLASVLPSAIALSYWTAANYMIGDCVERWITNTQKGLV